MRRGRTVFWGIVLIFVIYVIYTSPHQAADIARSIWHIITVAVSSLFTFFHALVKK